MFFRFIGDKNSKKKKKKLSVTRCGCKQGVCGYFQISEQPPVCKEKLSFVLGKSRILRCARTIDLIT